MKHEHYLFHAESVQGKNLFLGQNETHHVRDVLRITAGDEVLATDGKGNVFTCTIQKFEGKTSRASISHRQYCQRPAPQIEMFVGLPKKSAFEDALKALTALGVASVTPVECSYCQNRWWDKKWEKHLERLRKTVIAAAKQSLNAHYLQITPPLQFEDAVKNIGDEAVFFAEQKGEKLGDSDVLTGRKKQVVKCFTGPPGGFSEDEVSKLRQKNALPVQLSPFRLRTELAAVVMAGCVIQNYW